MELTFLNLLKTNEQLIALKGELFRMSLLDGDELDYAIKYLSEGDNLVGFLLKDRSVLDRKLKLRDIALQIDSMIDQIGNMVDDLAYLEDK